SECGGQPSLPPTGRASLAFDDVDDLVRLRAHDDVSATHQNEVVAAPLRIDLDDPRRKPVETDRSGNGGAHGDVEVHVGDFFDSLLLDGRRDLALFFRWRGGGRRGCGVARGLAARSGLGLCVVYA